MEKLKINNSDINKRLDMFLSEYLNETRSKITKNIKNKNILVNNDSVKPGYILKLSDEIIIKTLYVDTTLKPENIKLDIIYEDEYLIVVNKPSAMVVHPGGGSYSGTLVNALSHYTNKLGNKNEKERPGIVHRIDKDTSGLLLVSKSDKVHNILSNEFKKHNIKRKYIALVSGLISEDSGTIEAPIGRSESDRKKMSVTDKNSKTAITNFKVLERYSKATLLELILETGRTHQIRVHLNYINHPVINDPVYSKKVINDYGQMLHAYYIGFNHPITNEFLEFEAKPENEFNEILDMFKNS